jgi:lipoprotein signal peptidase
MLWKENPYYRFGQQFIIGAIVANNVLYSMETVYDNAIYPLVTEGKVLIIIPVLLGLLMYTRLTKEYAWASRYPLSMMLGVGMAALITGSLRGQVIDQIHVTAIDVLTALKTSNPIDIVNAIIIFIGVVTTILYFVLTREQTGMFYISSRVARIFLMISIGTLYSRTMFYLTSLVGRMKFLWEELIVKVILGMF